MKIVKNIIKKLLGQKLLYKLDYSKKLFKKLHRKNGSKYEFFKIFLKAKVEKNENKGLEIKRLFSKVKIGEIKKEDKYYYHIDMYRTLYSKNSMIGNFTIDYNKILNNSIDDLKNNLKSNKKDENFYNNEINVIEGIEILINRIEKRENKKNSNSKILKNISNIKTKKADSFYEALQRILFLNQLLWQTGHTLNGLGRLDKILYPYYKKDIENKVIDESEAKELIKSFLIELHKFYEFKSLMLLGDTGQVIELGGKDKNNKYESNKLTYLFIEIMKEIKLPDPKVLLRVSKDMPRDLMVESVNCIQTGIGCPLFANDDIIIDKLIEFGYKKEDAYNYGTSACWEPYIIGKSLEHNNIRPLVFIKPFENMLNNLEEDITIENKEQLIEQYKKHLEKYIDDLIMDVSKIKWEKDPLISLIIDDCIQKNIDISEGGAIYNNYGFTGVSLPNLVNSIINIDKFVFKNKEYTFKQINDSRKNNFDNDKELVNKLKNEKTKYGTDNEEVLEITNNIIKFTSAIMKKYKNSLGGSYKFGLSAPSYIDESKNFPASFDGRRKGEPFAVHISSDNSNAYTELIQFASKLDYNENRFNGNVIDFMVSPNFIKDNFEKFVDFLMLSIKVGFFEMQINVVSSKTLIEARKNPEKFPNLIVRVWGFSSYFNDLPDEYKDYIIERAIKSENNN